MSTTKIITGTTLSLTLGQVKEMAETVRKSFTVENKGLEYTVTAHGKWVGIFTPKEALASLVEYEILQLCGATLTDLNPAIVGADTANANKAYIEQIRQRVVNILCGFYSI